MADLSDSDLNRALVSVTAANAVVLGCLTFMSVEESRKMAQAAQAQMRALQLDSTPRLVAALSRDPASKIGGPKSETFVLLNLSRHNVWIDSVEHLGGGTATVWTPEGSEQSGLASLRGGRYLAPGDKLEINFQDLGLVPPFLHFAYYYAPTGPQLHTQSWAIHTIDGVHSILSL